MNKASDDKPWVRNTAWAEREVISARPIGGFVLAMSYLFFGLPGLFLIVYAASDALPVGVLLLAAVAGFTYLWLRGVRYGNSVCRLLTLPGVIGGWFKADVECTLPQDSVEPVTIQLINTRYAGRSGRELWRMERKLESDLVPVAGTERSIVRVRLRVPREPGQQACSIDTGPFESRVTWRLVIKKKSRGISFCATFIVPIFDIPDAPASEQRTE